MSELVILNGASNIARSLASAHILRNAGKYASVKLIDARPNRQSVYQWQPNSGVETVQKCLARNAQSIDLHLEGAKEVLYVTHDYTTMSSDKNSHLVAAAKLAKKQGVKNLVAVCPIEHDLAWSEDEKSFYEKTIDAENEALAANPSMTLLRTNLTFGRQTHLINFLTQCAIVGKSPYKNLVGKNNFNYAPIHIDDVAAAAGHALVHANHGRHVLAGSEHMNLRQILDTLETGAGRSPGGTGSPMLPAFDYLWDFLVGTTNDVNLSRMVDFYENNQDLSGPLSTNTWTETSQETSFSNFYNNRALNEEDYSHPTMAAYKCSHLD